MLSVIYFLSSGKESFFPRKLQTFCEGSLAIKVSANRKSTLFSQEASRRGAQNISLQQFCINSNDCIQVGTFANALNTALSAYEERLYQKLRSEIERSNNERIILIGNLSELKKIARFFTNRGKHINAIPPWCSLFSIDMTSRKIVLISPH